MTYREAIEKWLNMLAAIGWEIHRYNAHNGNHLKIPYARGEGYTVWFHPQSIHYGNTRESSRSLHMDMKAVNYLELMRQLKIG